VLELHHLLQGHLGYGASVIFLETIPKNHTNK